MAPDDLNTAQDAVVGVGLAPTAKDSTTATPHNGPVPGHRPHPDTDATPGTADGTLSHSSPVQNSTATTNPFPPQPPSIPIEPAERPAATLTPSTTPTPTPTPATTTTTSTTTTSTTTTTASTATEIEPIGPPEPSAAPPAASPQAAAVQPSPSSPSSPATVAAPALPPSRPPQNGDSKEASETDSDMASYRPSLTSGHGQPVSYSPAPPTMASSTTYLSTSMPPVTSAYVPFTTRTGSGMDTQHFSYSASTGVSHPNEDYRASPVPGGSSAVSAASNPLSLPSMRTIDAMSQRVSPPYGPHHPVAMSMSAALTPASSSPATYYATQQHAMPVPSNYALPSDSHARYPLPHDPRVLGSRGPKKEIKRRTKTGCLTCRKRRIKCDETHPTCNNCKKSKRECLGYDPIFRQQPGASHIQPAPAATSQLTVPSSSTPRSTTSVAVGHSPAANSYGSQPSMLPSSYSASPSPSTLPSSSTAHANTSTASSNYASPAAAAAGNATPAIKTEVGSEFSSLAVKSEPGFDFSTPIDRSSRQLPVPNGQELAKPFDYTKDKSQKMKITEIIDLLGPPPPPQQISHTEDTFNEITRVYHEMYAGGLSAFMETNWYYFVDKGKMTFPKDANLIEHMATFLKILEAVKANDHSQMAYSGVLETRIVWELACTAYQTPERTNQTMRLVMAPDGDATEARNRLRVVDTLLCGEYLAANPLSPPLSDADVHRTRQFDFWYSLAEFVRERDSPDSAQAVKDREDALTRMRHLLDGRENRDVLYSVAVVRELAPRYGPSYGSTPQHLDESDPKNRLAVASKFILDEAQVTGGTTNVVRRFSDIASRAFVNPAVNVVRRTV